MRTIQYGPWPTIRKGKPLSPLFNRVACAAWELDFQWAHLAHMPTVLDMAESICPPLARVTSRIAQP